ARSGSTITRIMATFTTDSRPSKHRKGGRRMKRAARAHRLGGLAGTDAATDRGAPWRALELGGWSTGAATLDRAARSVHSRPGLAVDAGLAGSHDPPRDGSAAGGGRHRGIATRPDRQARVLLHRVRGAQDVTGGAGHE